MSEPVLSLEELRSPVWRKIKAHVEAELAMLRKHLESDQTPEKTAKLRGQIRSHVLLLALENPPQAPVLEETNDE